MSFLDTRLSTGVELGAQGGLGFSTSITTLKSGHEKRNANWEHVRGEWDLGYRMDTIENRRAVWELHMVCYGMGHSFRFKDHADFEMARQVIGETDASTADFEIYKRYTYGGYTYDRYLTKIVSGSVSAWIGSTSRTVVYDVAPGALEVKIVTLTGVATLGSSLVSPASNDIEILCEFDVPVRFALDKLDRRMLMPDYADVPNVPIVEVRTD